MRFIGENGRGRNVWEGVKKREQEGWSDESGKLGREVVKEQEKDWKMPTKEREGRRRGRRN